VKKSLTIVSVAGARPNFMKIAPLAWAAAVREGVLHSVIHTGQHYDDDMSAAFFRDLDVQAPEFNLGVGSGPHAWQTARIMERLEPLLAEKRPDWVVVVGDVNSTMAAALTVAKLGIKCAHVEAGLRSFDRTMPEEINRIVTDQVCDMLFTHSEEADRNLAREGVPGERIKRVGNIMIDTLVKNLDKAVEMNAPAGFGVEPGEYAYVTLHRPNNVDDRQTLAKIVSALVELSGELSVVFPVHPRTRLDLESHGLLEKLEAEKHINVTGPLGYHESIGLVKDARFVLTDSGGLQEETTYLGVPCLTLRPNTERPVTVMQGTNRLTSLALLSRDIEDTLAGRHPPGGRAVPELWDGKTAERILEVLVQEAG